MRPLKSIFAVALSLLLPLSALKLPAQNILVQGTHLNIGSGNDINASVMNHYLGNAIGLQNKVKSYYSVAVGTNDTVNTNSSNSVALGKFNSIQGENAMAFGRSVKIVGDDNIGIGHHVRASSREGCIVIGSGIIGSSGNEAYLVNSVSNSLAIGFKSTKPTLFVSASPNNYNTGITDKTGKVAIGDVTPLAKLHIRSDAGEDAGIILEPGNPTEDQAFIRLMDAQHNITVDTRGLMDISAGVGNLLGFSSSNFKLDENLLRLGLGDDKKMTFSTAGTASIGLNALPSNGYYLRGSYGSSYVMEFSDAAFKLRTATYMNPRNDVINNWVDALAVKTAGTITLNGKVGVNIENTTSDYALAVDGGLITTKVHIQEVGDWQDRVFGEDYRLMPLGEVEAYVAEHRHLPGIPSEAEVKANGYDMAEMQAALLGKVEELTLYLISQQREIDSLRTLVTVHFGYDACGNRVSRTLQFSRTDGDKGGKPGDNPNEEASLWQASVSEGFADGEVLLFPNPTEGGFFLSLTGGEVPDGTKATLCTPEGKILEERIVTGNTEEFDLGNRPAGIYLLRLTSEHETKAWKVVKRN